MAIMAVKNPSTLKIKFNHGSDNNGKAIIRSKSFSNVKADASDDNLYAVTKALVALQDHDLYDVLKIDNTALSE